MLMIFEDSNESTLVNLIRDYYNGIVTVIGAHGSGKVRDVYNKQEKGQYALIYIDVVPDNYETIRTYNKLKKEFRDNNKVLIIPIVCSEYILLRSFTKYDMSVWDTISLEDYSSVGSNIRTAEQFYKGYIKQLGICIIPDNHSTIDTGKYYRKDCDCECNITDINKLALCDKRRYLVYKLPLRFTMDSSEEVSMLSACDIIHNIEMDFNCKMQDYLRYNNIANANMYFISDRVQHIE